MTNTITVSAAACPAAVCPGKTILSVRNGDWSAAATWNLNRVPNADDVVLVQADHTVVGPALANIKALCNYSVLPSMNRSSLEIRATQAISNYGLILGRDGGVGVGAACGGQGSSIKLRGSPFYNEGMIWAGDGGDGNRCGGKGGSTTVLGRNTTNEGTICAGDGGDVLGVGAGWGGKGGRTIVWGKRGGAGFLRNRGLICGGDGGDGNPFATGAQRGGRGGDVKLISLPTVDLKNGVHFAGSGGLGTGGGVNGRNGRVFIEPNTISLAGSETRVGGGDVLIFGGDGWVLDLSNMSGAAITATGNITLAVGSGGAIDLSGNTSQVFQADGQVIIASDVISLETGVDLITVVGTNVITGPSQILYDFSLDGSEQETGQPGVTLPIELTLLNDGPEADTYDLELLDSAGWSLGTLPSSVMVEGLDLSDLTLNVTLPSGAASGDTNVITITATSQTDPNLVAVAEIEVFVDTRGTDIYLPLVLRNYTPPPTFFDDFSDPNSGWRVGSTTDVVRDYDNGNYRIQIKTNNLIAWSTAPNFTCADCTIEIEAWRSTGGNSLYGIMFGLDSGNSEFYVFRIQPYNRKYALHRYDRGTWVTLIPYTDSYHINFDTGHNTLRVTRHVSLIKLYVNDHHLADYSDSTYTGSRLVGVAAISTAESPVWLRYDNFAVWGGEYGTMCVKAGGSGDSGVIVSLPDRMIDEGP